MKDLFDFVFSYIRWTKNNQKTRIRKSDYLWQLCGREATVLTTYAVAVAAAVAAADSSRTKIDGHSQTFPSKTDKHFFSFLENLKMCFWGLLVSQKLVPVLKRHLNQESNSCLQSLLGILCRLFPNWAIEHERNKPEDFLNLSLSCTNTHSPTHTHTHTI